MQTASAPISNNHLFLQMINSKKLISIVLSILFTASTAAQTVDNKKEVAKNEQTEGLTAKTVKSVDCTAKPCDTIIDDVYRPKATNSYFNHLDSPYSFYENPYQVSLFSAEHGEDGKRLWSQTKGVFAYGFIIIGAIAMLPEDVSNWDRGEIFGKWDENVKAGPVWDRDGSGINLIGHGYFGGVYYQVARKSGYRQWDAFMYSTLMSTFYWEYGIEAFAEVPSVQDLVLTPVLGWAYGEWAYQSEQDILRDGGEVWGSETLGSISMVVLDPIDSLSVGINNMFGHEIFVAGTGYIDYKKDVQVGTNGDTESFVQMGVTYQFGDGKSYNKSLNHQTPAKQYRDPVDYSIIGFALNYGTVNLDDSWETEGGTTSGFSAGLYFSKKLSARLLYEAGDMQVKGSNKTKSYESYSINTQYYLNTQQSLRPFIQAGFGQMIREENNEKQSFQTHYGAGLHYQISNNFSLQTDGRYYYATSTDTAEIAYSATLIYRLGKGEKNQ